MSFELQLNNLYEQIAQHVNEMIPVEWSEIYFNGEVKGNEGGVYFFFIPVDSQKEVVYSHDIPDLYNVSEKSYDQEIHKLFELTSKVQQVFIENDQEPWSSVAFILNASGKLNVHFDYTNWHNSEFGPTDRIEYFEYKYVNQNKEQFDTDLMKRMAAFEKK